MGSLLVSAGIELGAAWSACAVSTALWITGAFFLNRMLGMFLMGAFMTRLRGRPFPRILKDTLSVAIALVTLSGIIGIGIGFALRPIILDIFSGIAVNIEDPFQIDDWVVIESNQARSPIAGWIDQVNWRTTQIRTRDGNLVIIPNSLLGTAVVTNFSAPKSHSRFEISFVLDYDVPVDRASRIILAGVTEVLGVDHGPLPVPRPEVLVGTASPDGVEYRLRYWLDARETSEPQVRSVVTTSVLRHPACQSQAGCLSRADARLRQAARFTRVPREPSKAGRSLRAAPPRRTRTTCRRLHRPPLRRRHHARRRGRSRQLDVRAHPGAAPRRRTLLKVRVRGAEGASREVARLGPGQFFGEMSLFTGEPRSATVETACESVAAEITKGQMESLLRSRSEIAGLLTRAVVERCLHTTQALANLAEKHHDEHRATLASQVLSKMKKFFNLS